MKKHSESKNKNIEMHHLSTQSQSPNTGKMSYKAIKNKANLIVE